MCKGENMPFSGNNVRRVKLITFHGASANIVSSETECHLHNSLVYSRYAIDISYYHCYQSFMIPYHISLS